MLQQGSSSTEAGVRHCQRKQSRTQEARATPLPRAAICNSTKEKENQGVLIQGYDTGVSGQVGTEGQEPRAAVLVRSSGAFTAPWMGQLPSPPPRLLLVNDLH